MKLVRQCKLPMYFQKYGWKFRRNKINTIISGWKSATKNYTLEVKSTREFTCFSVKILELPSADSRLLELVAHKVNEKNHEMLAVKASWDDHFAVYLNFQSFTDSLSYNCFYKIIGMLSYYSDLLSDELSELIVHRSLSKKLHKQNHEIHLD